MQVLLGTLRGCDGAGWFERVGALRQLVAEDLVDQGAGLGESRVHDLPQHAALLAMAPHEPVALEDGEVLRYVGPADLEQLGQLARGAGLIAEMVHELVPGGVRERGEHRGVDGVTLALIVHDAIVSKFRNFATWNILEQELHSDTDRVTRKESTMEMNIYFPGGKRVYADYGGFTIETDQPARGGGDDSAPAPFDLFLASIGTCAGIFALGFMQQRGIDPKGSKLTMRPQFDPQVGLITNIDLELELPAGFPAKYQAAIVNAMNLCTVKKHLHQPPEFNVTTVSA